MVEIEPKEMIAYLYTKLRELKELILSLEDWVYIETANTSEVETNGNS